MIDPSRSGPKPRMRQTRRPKTTSLRCPSDLPPDGKTLWRRVVKEYEAAELLDGVDALTLDLACRHYAIALQAFREVATLDGLAVADKDTGGTPRRHPVLQVLRENTAAYQRLMKELGLTPTARDRLRINKTETGPADDVASLLD